jgi:hypothetical protein
MTERCFDNSIVWNRVAKLDVVRCVRVRGAYGEAPLPGWVGCDTEQNLRNTPGTEPLRQTFLPIERLSAQVRRSFSEARVYFLIEIG